MGFHLVTVVWGSDFTDIFLNLVLPSLLSPGNLPVFQEMKQSVYKIYTTAKDAEVIAKSKKYKLLTEIINTKIKVFRFPRYPVGRYQYLTFCQKHALIEAYKQDCAFVYLTPDNIYANGSFTNLLKIVATGKRVVMEPSFTVTAEKFIPVAKKKLFSIEENGRVSIDSRRLIKIAISYLHPIEKALFWKSTDFSGWPALLYWSVKEDGLLKRAFHLHPLMIRPKKKWILPSGTVDGSKYLDLACPNLEEFYIVEDSDEIMSVGIKPLNHPVNHFIRQNTKSSVNEVAEWAKREASSCHRHFFQHKIRIHGNEISENQWKAIEEESDRVVQKINAMIDYKEAN